jgi:tRNA threonylcarbamoyladenosine biosynthesis protein TsaB
MTKSLANKYERNAEANERRAFWRSTVNRQRVPSLCPPTVNRQHLLSGRQLSTLTQMNLLAIDTATERCSVAARINGAWIERTVDTQRGHADVVLTMVDEVMKEGGIALGELNGIAYGRGPGAFTGVRIAVGVVQGLAFGAQLATVGVSNLAAVAQQVAERGGRILACMDARMSEVYWAGFTLDTNGLVDAATPERLTAPSAVKWDNVAVLAGTAMAAYAELAQRFASVQQIKVLPRARDILLLGEREFAGGRTGTAFDAQPVYLRDQVTFVKPG